MKYMADSALKHSDMNSKKASLLFGTCFIFHVLLCPIYFFHGLSLLCIYNAIISFLYIMLLLFRDEVPAVAFLVIYTVELVLYSILVTFAVRLDCGAEVITLSLVPTIFFAMNERARGGIWFKGLAVICAAASVFIVVYQNVTSAQTYAVGQLSGMSEATNFISRNFIQFHYSLCMVTVFVNTVSLGWQFRNELIAADRAAVLKARELDFISNHDPLTKLLNRRKSLEYTRTLEKRKLQLGSDWSVCIFDVDNFKHINDYYGHDCGDVVLKAIAQLISQELEGRPEIQFSRWGGEEFLITFPFAGEEPKLILEELRKKIPLEDFSFRNSKAAQHNSFELVHITATFGFATSQEERSGEGMLNLADNYLREGKRNGKNQVVGAAEFRRMVGGTDD